MNITSKIAISLLLFCCSLPGSSVTLSNELTSFAFMGDILMGSSYPDSISNAYLPAKNGADLFKNCENLIKNVDVACGNHEGTLIDIGGKPKLCSNPKTCFTFRTPTSYVKNLVNAGFDFMNIANNHINDFGNMGRISTQLTLKNAGIAYAGLVNDCPTAIIVRNGKKIGFASFGHSRGTCNLNDLNLVRSTVSELKKNTDLVVVTFHGGEEGSAHNRIPFATEFAFNEQRGNVYEFAHAAIDAGADIVYGHGPHVTRAMELYNNRLIMYSLGNFCTPFRMNISGISGHAPLVTVNLLPDGTFHSGQIHPFLQVKGHGPKPDPSGSVINNIRRLSKLDFPDSPLVISPTGALSR